VRKQYHFRPGETGLRAWDVERLVALSADISPTLVALADIGEIDETYWGPPVTCRDVADHARLIAEANLDFPIILSSDGRVMDGMHRVLKALIEGRTHILAVRFENDPEPDHVDVTEPDDLPCD
jgi:hypothetical protein